MNLIILTTVHIQIQMFYYMTFYRTKITYNWIESIIYFSMGVIGTFYGIKFIRYAAIKLK